MKLLFDQNLSIASFKRCSRNIPTPGTSAKDSIEAIHGDGCYADLHKNP